MQQKSTDKPVSQTTQIEKAIKSDRKTNWLFNLCCAMFAFAVFADGVTYAYDMMHSQGKERYKNLFCLVCLGFVSSGVIQFTKSRNRQQESRVIFNHTKQYMSPEEICRHNQTEKVFLKSAAVAGAVSFSGAILSHWSPVLNYAAMSTGAFCVINAGITVSENWAMMHRVLDRARQDEAMRQKG